MSDSKATIIDRSDLPSATVLLWLITACLMLQPISTDLYLPSLPHLVDYFAVTPALVQQTLTWFVVGFGTAQLISGPLSDRFGRRPVLLAGLVVYVLASAICALASTIGLLVVARFVQAVGCCTAVVIARAVIRDAYPPTEGTHVIAKASSLLAFAPLFGPLVGGYLQVAFGWRAAFILFCVLGLLLAAAVWWKLGETNRHRDPQAVNPARLARTYAGIARTPAFWAYALPGALSYGSIFVFIAGVAFALIEVLAVPTEYFGYAWAVGVSGYLSGTLVCRRLLTALGMSRTLLTGTACSAGAGVLFAVLILMGMHHWAVVVLCQFLTMFAHGINFPCGQSGAVAPFPRQAGAAAGLLGSAMMLAAFAVGTWTGASHDGTLYPIAFTSAAVGLILFGSALVLARFRDQTP